MNHLEFQKHANTTEIVISVGNPFLAQVVLIFLEVLITIMPIAALIYSIAVDSFTPVILMGFVAYAAIVWLPFSRITFWSVKGREFITLTPEAVDYYYDYKFYKSKKGSIPLDSVKFDFVFPESKKNKIIGNLVIYSSDENKYTSVLKITVEDYQHFVKAHGSASDFLDKE